MLTTPSTSAARHEPEQQPNIGATETCSDEDSAESDHEGFQLAANTHESCSAQLVLS